MDSIEKVNLTSDEWMSLIAKDGAGLPACCANVSHLRDRILTLAREGGQVDAFSAPPLLAAYRVFLDGHESPPNGVLAKLVAQVEAITGQQTQDLPHFDRFAE